MVCESVQVTIEWAYEQDIDWLIRHDPHVRKGILRGKVARREVIVARKEGAIVGWLRFNLFWDSIPFIILLFVLEDQRGQDIGSRLVTFFEQRMRERMEQMRRGGSSSSGRGRPGFSPGGRPPQRGRR